MKERGSFFDLRVFLIALAVFSAAYAAARGGFAVTFDDFSQGLFTPESFAPRDSDQSDRGDPPFLLHADKSAAIILGSAVVLAGLLGLIRRDPRVFLITLALLTCALLLVRLGFAALFGDASVIDPTLPDAVKSSIEPRNAAEFVVALVFLLLGLAGLATLQTTVGFALGPISFPAYLLALALLCFFAGRVVARRAAGRARGQISLGAVVGCALPLAYGSFRFESIALAVISGAVLLPIAWLATWIGASCATPVRGGGKKA